jgi:hypothetical protein
MKAGKRNRAIGSTGALTKVVGGLGNEIELLTDDLLEGHEPPMITHLAARVRTCCQELDASLAALLTRLIEEDEGTDTGVDT